MTQLTIIIPTKDEELHVARAIASVLPLGRVIVLDACSADRTQAIAHAAGVEVVERPWQGYAAQKNWALSNLGIETEWVFFLDADEWVTERGQAELIRSVTTGAADGYLVPRKYIFLGRPLEHAWWYPDYQLRLFRRARGRFEDRRVHEHVIVDGVVETLSEPLMHENLKGLSAFIARHNAYSDLEAEEMTSPSSDRLPASLTGTRSERRRAVKERIWYRLPFRPLIRFLWLYIVRRGFLDGRRGFVFSCFMAVQEFHINAKVLERRLPSG